MDIRIFIHEKLQHVDDYQTIKKSVQILNDMVSDAKENDVSLDHEVIAKVNSETARLLAE